MSRIVLLFLIILPVAFVLLFAEEANITYLDATGEIIRASPASSTTVDWSISSRSSTSNWVIGATNISELVLNEVRPQGVYTNYRDWDPQTVILIDAIMQAVNVRLTNLTLVTNTVTAITTNEMITTIIDQF